MDPKANIAQQVEIARELMGIYDGAHPETGELHPADGDRVVQLACELSELVLAQDAWRLGGGFDPYTRTR